MMDRIVLIENAVETLGYFSRQLAAAWERRGLKTYVIDYERMYETLDGLRKFAVKGRTALCTFNFIGLSGEDIFLGENGDYLWDDYEMEYFNILVDHPLYYDTKLALASSGMHIFCIDRDHVRYIRRYYPGLHVEFLPLAGNILLGSEADENGCRDGIYDRGKEQIPYEKRRYDLVFTANYVSTKLLSRRFEELDPEYAAFYRGIAEDMIRHPSCVADEVMERHIRRELGEVSGTEMRGALAGMALVDLYVRAYYREAIVRKLAEAGIKVHVFGADWERFSCGKTENIVTCSGQVRSSVCVRAVRNARIALNVMPWFKDGAHDRVFTAMLQGTVALTDGSKYLSDMFSDGQDICFFSLQEIGALPDKVRALLADDTRAAQIAQCGHDRAGGSCTWDARAAELMKYF